MAAQYAYLVVTPDPTYFQSVQTLSGQFPTVSGLIRNAPVNANGPNSRVCHVKFGDQSSIDGALSDYKRANPNFIFITISINGLPVPGWNKLGKFLEDRVLGTVGSRHANAPPFQHVRWSEEWYCLWNRDQLLRDFINLYSTASKNASAAATAGHDANKQNLHNTAQRNLYQPLVQHIQALKQGNAWPGWANFDSGKSGFTNQAQQRNTTMQLEVDNMINTPQRLVWVDMGGVLHFANELAAVCFFDKYLHTD